VYRHRFKYGTLAVVLALLGLITWYWVVQGNPFRKPIMEKEDKLVAWLEDTASCVRDERWIAARDSAQKAADRYTAVRSKLQFAADRGEMESFSRTLTRLLAAIEMKERVEAYLLAKELITMWKGIANP